jgi:hypothetical protein
MSKTRKNPSALPPLSQRPQRNPGHVRPEGVQGRMKPLKVRRMLREWMKDADPEEDARVSDEMDRFLRDEPLDL